MRRRRQEALTCPRSLPAACSDGLLRVPAAVSPVAVPPRREYAFSMFWTPSVWSNDDITLPGLNLPTTWGPWRLGLLPGGASMASLVRRE